MPLRSVYLPYKETGSFSSLVIDYLAGAPGLAAYYYYSQDLAGIAQAIENRSRYETDRSLLADTLQRQYTGFQITKETTGNIALLRHKRTFTICTAHQPNLLTGYLYFIYKILHAIKLAAICKEHYPEYDFVPVYYMGSEDNDLQELGTFRYGNEQYTWDAAGQTGAVGRMKTESLAPLLATLYKHLGPPGGNLDTLHEILEQAYKNHNTVGAATRYLVNVLFGSHGLVVLDPDDAELKRSFIPVMERDLIRQDSLTMVTGHTTALSERYKIQAYPRPVNLFYLTEGIRERIEEKNGTWYVLNTTISWNKDDLLKELHAHPERFSPNVILRPLYQEMILPDIVFIGGGAEVAYWLQLKTLFEAHGIFYPAIHLRQSALWIGARWRKLQKRLGLSTAAIFRQEQNILHDLLLRNGNRSWDSSDELKAIEAIMLTLKKKAADTDATLRSAAEAALARIRHQVHTLEKKMLRAEKRKMGDKLQQITRLKDGLFPNGKLQERTDNFIGYYLDHGPDFFKQLLDHMEPLRHEFLIIQEEEMEA